LIKTQPIFRSTGLCCEVPHYPVLQRGHEARDHKAASSLKDQKMQANHRQSENIQKYCDVKQQGFFP